MFLLYNLLLILISPFLVAYQLFISIRSGRRSAIKERFGFIDEEIVRSLKGNRPIWVHAVSVGETVAVKPLLTALKAEYPHVPLIVSNMTETGRGVAITIKEVAAAVYFPFDYPFAARRLLKSINPAQIIIVETELWPNFLSQARKLQIPTVIINGRISDRSINRYLALKRFFSPILQNITAFCMQNQLYAERIVSIGAPSDKVSVTRNLKFDIPVRSYTHGQLDDIRSRYRIDGALKVFIAASTHQGEDEQVVEAFQRICEIDKSVAMILVPRHPERGAMICQLLDKQNLPHVRRTSLSSETPLLAAGEVLLVDTVGELMQLYAISDVVFVGGSLVPTGGHNLLEPASLGRAVLFGTYMSNFRDIAAMMLDYGAGVQIGSSSELAEAALALLNDTDARKLMGMNGHRLLKEEGGATEMNMAVIRRFLSKSL